MEEGSQQSCAGAGLGQVMSIPFVEPCGNFGCALLLPCDTGPMPTAFRHAWRMQGLRQVTARLAEVFPLPVLQMSILTLLLLSMPIVKPQEERQPHQSQQQNSTCAEEICLLPGAAKWLSSFSLSVCGKKTEQIHNF